MAKVVFFCTLPCIICKVGVILFVFKYTLMPVRYELVQLSKTMVLTSFDGTGVGFGFGVGCGFGVGWGFGGMPLNFLGLGVGGGCGIGLGLGWGFGTAFGSQYRSDRITFQGMDFKSKGQGEGRELGISKSSPNLHVSQ